MTGPPAVPTREVDPFESACRGDHPYTRGLQQAREHAAIDAVTAALASGRLSAERLTLAPPIARAVTRVHPGLYTLFNLLPPLRTHVLCWIAKP